MMHMKTLETPIIVSTDPLDDAPLSDISGCELKVLRDLAPETYRPLMRSAHILVVRSGAPIPPEMLSDCPRLVGVVRWGAGVDVVPMAIANSLAIPVANAPGANAQSVAEYGLISMGLLSRRLHVADASLRVHGWKEAKTLTGPGHDLQGKTVGIIGLGEVGQRLARMCHYGLEMKVLGHQRRAERTPEFATYTSLDLLLAQSDFVVLACPLTAETKGLISAERLAVMKPSACLVNLARGELIDATALRSAIDRGALGGAALDVFAQEPLPPDDPLLTQEKMILTPHIAWQTKESAARTAEISIRHILQILRGQEPSFLVNPQIWDSGANRRRAILSTLRIPST